MTFRKLGAGALVLALASTLGLAACSSDEEPSGEDSPEPSAGETIEEVTLTITTWRRDETGIKDWYSEYVEWFESEHPGVTIEIENIPAADYVSTLTTRLTAGQGPTIIDIPWPTTTVPAWAEGGLLLPIDDLLADTEIPDMWPASQDVFKWGGETYGVLLADYPFLMFYNEQLLADAGLELPTTPEEFLSAVQKLTTGEKFGFAITADNSTNFFREVAIFLAGEGATWATPGEWHWTDADVVAAVDDFRTAAKLAPRGVDQAAKRQAYLDGNVAMMFDGPFYLAAAQANAGPEAQGKLHAAAMPFPITPGDVSLGYALPAEGDPATRDLAWEYIVGAASEEWQTRYAEVTQSTVTRPGSSDILADNPEASVAVEEKEDAVTVVPMNLEGLRARYSDFMNIVAPAFHELINTDVDTAQALAALQQKLEQEGLLP